MIENKDCHFMAWPRVLFTHTCYITSLNMSSEGIAKVNQTNLKPQPIKQALVSTMSFCWRQDLVRSLNVDFI